MANQTPYEVASCLQLETDKLPEEKMMSFEEFICFANEMRDKNGPQQSDSVEWLREIRTGK